MKAQVLHKYDPEMKQDIWVKEEEVPNPKIEKDKSLIKVNYVGMGWMLVKKGVFESIKYPWFEPIRKTIGGYTDFTMEDVAFCHKAIEQGHDIYVDPKIIVGHEKTVVL